jgi:hypothetical protein
LILLTQLATIDTKITRRDVYCDEISEERNLLPWRCLSRPILGAERRGRDLDHGRTRRSVVLCELEERWLDRLRSGWLEGEEGGYMR